MDFIFNGAANGSVAEKLASCGFDPGVLRPYIDKSGRHLITVNKGGKPVTIQANNAATLRYDEWKQIDDTVLKAARSRLKLVADIRAAGLTYSIPNGMGKTVLSTETMNDPGFAVSSMDALRGGANDRPQYDLTNLPLPITHSEFGFSARQLEASRSGGSPLDLSMAEACGRRVAEQVEKLTIGVADSFTFGGGTVYGLTNYTNVNSQVLTAPTAGGWTGDTLLGEILTMRQTAYGDNMYGPYRLYNAPNWDAYLDEDFKAASDVTLRERILKINNIQSCETLDYLTNYDMVLVQFSSDVIRLVIGMDVTTLQWEERGGLLKNFMVMCIMVPQIRADYNSKCGIVHGATA